MTELLKNLRTATDKIIEFVENHSKAQLNLKNPPDDWSILECVEHVFISEKVIYKVLNSPELFSDKPSTVDDNITEYRSGKFEAPEYTLPKGRFANGEEIVSALKILRSQIESYIINELPKSGNETASHPILGQITKTQWIEFVIEHSERHLLQMVKCSEKLDQLNNPSGI